MAAFMVKTVRVKDSPETQTNLAQPVALEFRLICLKNDFFIGVAK